MMEAARTCETLVNFYQTTRRYNPEYSHLHTLRSENFKFYLMNDRLMTGMILRNPEKFGTTLRK
jgi:hypothetical protein